MNAYGKWRYSFLQSALQGGNCSSTPRPLYPRNGLNTRMMDPRSCLHVLGLHRVRGGKRFSYSFSASRDTLQQINQKNGRLPVKCGSLSPRHRASSGCGWRNGLLTWRVAANILNKQSRAADKGWSFSLGVGRRANKAKQKQSCPATGLKRPMGIR